MFNATYFTYDGIFSGTYGLKIADFNTDVVIETPVFSPTLNVSKPATSNRFFHNGIVYESAPQYQFSIVSEQPIDDVIRREILAWLTGRKEFKRLYIHQPDLESYYYNCVFTDMQIIAVNGRCHGFRFTANFDSPYQYGEPTVVNIEGTGVSQKILINNRSDIIDGYTYPIVSFKSNTGSIDIVNNTDDMNRHFILSGLLADEEITVDNELKYITSSRAGEKLSNFNKNWLRLRPGYNELNVSINGTGKIVCPTYVMIGF